MPGFIGRAFCAAAAAALLLALSSVGAAAAPTGATRVLAVAGTGSTGDRGDGGPARKAELAAPSGIAVDSAGDIAVADTDNCRVRMVAARSGRRFGLEMRAGRIYTVAGHGCRPPRSRRGSPVSLVDPTGVAFDAAGDLVIADGTGNRILEMAVASGRDFGLSVTAGELTAVAGTGAAGSSADGKPARSSKLDDPRGVAVDRAGDLYVADTSGCRVEMVPGHDETHAGASRRAGHLYRVAGTGVCGDSGDGAPAPSARLWAPSAVTVDGAGDLLIADEGDSAVREVPAASGTFYSVAIAAGNIGTVAGQGTHSDYLADGLAASGPAADLDFPSGLAVDAGGDLFIADSYERSIREVPAHDGELFGRSVVGGDMYTLAGLLPVGGSVPAGNGTRWVLSRMVYPSGVALGPGGALYFSDEGADSVRRIVP